ncbi:MAG: diguanylate cyclase [Acidimicrobiales bacterium]
MKLRSGAGPHSVYQSYVVVGAGATALMLAAIPVVCYLRPVAVDWAVIWTTFGVVGAVAATVLVLPWSRLVTHRAGQVTLYAWSMVDVGAVGAAIAATGGNRSWFWVVFVMTTVFFSAGYPFVGQLLLLGCTLATYLAGVAAGGSPVATTVDLWRGSVIVVTFVLASFPSLELRRQTGEHDRARQDADRLAVRLEERETWWRSLIEHTSDPIVVFDESHSVVFASPAFESLLGYTPEEAMGMDLSVVVHPEELEEVQVATALVRDGRPATETTCRVRRKDGEWRHLEVSFAAVSSDNSLVANLHDVTKRVEAEVALTHLATHDPLTGLSNSRAFYHALDVSLAIATRREHPLALVLVDLDRFKEANDTFGHAFGDQLLIGVARQLESTLRDADVIARLGGDEFTAVLTTGADPVGAAAAARRLWEALGATMVVADQEWRLKVSVGVACFPDHGHDPDELLRCADHAMYRAKRGGLGVAVYDQSPAPGAVR